MEMPEAAVAETAHAFANKMREPDQTVYEKAEKIADEVRIPSCLRLNHNAR